MKLTNRDCAAIVALEQYSFIPSLQASVDAIQQRFALGHHMLGLYDDGCLSAMLAYYRGNLNPNRMSSYPKSFVELVQSPHDASGNTAFLYNMEVHPQFRGGRKVKQLIHMALDEIKAAGCTYAIANCRIPSYAGSQHYASHEIRKQKMTVKQAIDSYFEHDRFPSQAALMQDPYLALIKRATGCDFKWLIKDFVNDDPVTQGIRALAFGELARHPVAKVWRGECAA